MEFTQERLDDVEQSVNSLKKSIKFQQEKSDLMERKYNANLRDSAILKEKWLNTETYIRRENLKFSGITEDNGETAIQKEHKLREVLKNNLGITDIGSIDFQRCHRLGFKSDDSQKPRDIIARFCWFPDRQEVFISSFIVCIICKLSPYSVKFIIYRTRIIQFL